MVLCWRSEVSKELQNEYLDTSELEKYDIFREAKKKKEKTINTRPAIMRYLTSSPITQLPRNAPVPLSTS